MQVDPTRLVELAASSESILTAMAHDWQAAADDLAEACAGLGDATGTPNVAASYADSLADAGEVVTALTQALGARDRRAGRRRAGRRTRRRHRRQRAGADRPPDVAPPSDGFGTMPGRGGR